MSEEKTEEPPDLPFSCFSAVATAALIIVASIVVMLAV